MKRLISTLFLGAAISPITGLNATTPLEVLTPACEISIALSAAPDWLRDGAGVFVLTAEGFTQTRVTQNKFTCIVNRDHPAVLKPTCFDTEGTETIIPKITYFGDRLLKGIDVETVQDEVAEHFRSGKFISPRRPGVAYMLSRYNRPVNRQTGALGFFPPHVMFYAPNLTNEDIGHDMAAHNPARPLPMIAYGGPQGYMLMISDDGAPRQRSDLDKSCPDWIWAE